LVFNNIFSTIFLVAENIYNVILNIVVILLHADHACLLDTFALIIYKVKHTNLGNKQTCKTVISLIQFAEILFKEGACVNTANLGMNF
jgi:hypothetical protein